MGAVYLARDPLFDRDVALKTVLLPEGSEGDAGDPSRARFREEARLSGRLSHPNIVAVYDCGDEGRTLWISMEYVAGGSLATRVLAGGPRLPVAEKLGILADVAGALSHAHARGVIHRDVKPANILLTPGGVPKVSDFGIGKLLAGGVDLTATGEMVGSPAYMSPEQMRGERADTRSDLFSFGIVLYQILTGKKPFPAENLTALVRQIQHEEPDDPRSLDPEVPDAAVAILSRLLAKAPEYRYSSAAAVQADLLALRAAVLGGDGGMSITIAASTVPFPEALPPPGPDGQGTETSARTRPVPGPPSQAGLVSSPGPRSHVRELLFGLGAAGTLLVLGLLLSGPGERVEAPADSPGGAPAVPVRVPPRPSPIPTGAPSPPPRDEGETDLPAVPLEPALALDIRPSSVRVQRLVVARGLRFAVDPAQARLFLDGRFVGIAEDWSGEAGAPDLDLPAGGTHTVRLAHAGRRDLVLDVTVERGAAPGARVEAALSPGRPGGSQGTK